MIVDYHNCSNGTACDVVKLVLISIRVCYQATSVVPNLDTVKAVQKIAWSASSGSLHLVHASNEDIHKAFEKVSLSSFHFSFFI